MTATLTPRPITTEPSLDDRIAATCGHLNACYAQLVDLVAEVIASEAWRGWGIHSVEHWITWRTGLTHAHAKVLVALAGAADTHPSVIAAFRSGELSVDQAALAIKAQPQHEADIAEWARSMTLPQLRLAVRASNTSAADVARCAAQNVATADEATVGETDDRAAIREHLSLRQDEDGSWALHGRLDPDHGAIVDAALSEARDRQFREGDHDVTWADALVDVAQRALDAVPLDRRERFRVNLFIDPENSPSATWTCGIRIPDAITELLTCDGLLSPIFVADGRPVSVGRSQRIVPDRTRRIVLHRDKQCRNPLCGVRRGLEVHHIWHWVDGGPTVTPNLITLCRRCHRAHHRGQLFISGDADDPGGVEFRDRFDRVLDPATHMRPPAEPPPEPERPYRHPLGERLDRWAIVFNPPRPPSRN